MALFSSRESNHDIHRDIEALRRDIAALSRTVSKRGSAALRGAADEASGLYDDMAERFNSALPVIRRRARDIEDTIRDNPTRSAAVVGIAALTVAALAFLMSNRR